MVEHMYGTYNDLAEEYYDGSRHPTCANFRDGSAKIYEQWLSKNWSPDGWICETGAGRSLVSEIACQRSLPCQRIILLDSAPRMMTHSAESIRGGCHAVLADALRLPFADRSLSLLIATLGDPYNVPAFWQETARVLTLSGTVIFTTPSHAWASAFRHNTTNERSVAEFQVRDGRRIHVPSFIYPEDQQTAMMHTCGLQVEATTGVGIGQLDSTQVSAKLRCITGGEIVTGYWATIR